MELEGFWHIVETAGGVRGFQEEGGRQRMTKALTAMPVEEIKAFEDMLSKYLYDLDLRDLARQPVVNAIEDHRPVRLSSDGFLYARCAVVLEGREAYAEVLRDYERFAPFTSLYCQHADLLLDVASDAYGAATGQEWDHDTLFDYETGANAAGWGRRQ